MKGETRKGIDEETPEQVDEWWILFAKRYPEVENFNDGHILQHANELDLLFKGCATTEKYVVVPSATNTTTISKNNDATSTTKHQFGLNEEEVDVESMTPENTKRQSKSQESV